VGVYVTDLVCNDAAAFDPETLPVDAFGVDLSGCNIRPSVLREKLVGGGATFSRYRCAKLPQS
jgi:hypothetical protein